jgi:diguanylate cyclase (GGDEF)-like protein
MILFAAFILLVHYSRLFEVQSEWLFSTEIWVMALFVTCMVWYTGCLESPLTNLYFLPVIMSSLMLRQTVTALQVVLITAFYLLIGFWQYGLNFFEPSYLIQFIQAIAPIILVSYITSILALDIKQTKQRLRTLSETDQLTGLLNMRAFDAYLKLEVERCQRYGHKFVILMIDADNFKEINDHYGHEAGNKLIKNIGFTVEANLRSSDIVARYGGDEFICLLIETGLHDAGIVARRIHEQISKLSVMEMHEKVSTSVSVGIACFPEDAKTMQELIKCADQAMYASKGKGKNQVSSIQAA